MENWQTMSDSEKEIMNIIWENGGSIYISELLDKVEALGKGWKRTTVRTFLTRLMEKGLIKAERHGKMSEYVAGVSEEEYRAGRARCFVDEVFDGNVKSLLASLIGQERMEEKEIDKLQDFWEKCKEDMR